MVCLLAARRCSTPGLQSGTAHIIASSWVFTRGRSSRVPMRAVLMSGAARQGWWRVLSLRAERLFRVPGVQGHSQPLCGCLPASAEPGGWRRRLQCHRHCQRHAELGHGAATAGGLGNVGVGWLLALPWLGVLALLHPPPASAPFLAPAVAAGGRIQNAITRREGREPCGQRLRLLPA